MTRKTRVHFLVGDPARFVQEQWQYRGKWCTCTIILGCPHGHCPACGRRTTERQHLDGTLAGTDCDKPPTPLTRAEREDLELRTRNHQRDPSPPRPRSVLWCASNPDGPCLDAPASGSLTALQQHGIDDHGITMDDLHNSVRIVSLLANGSPILGEVGPREEWPRDLDYLPIMITWHTPAGKPWLASVRVPPALAEGFEQMVPHISLRAQSDV